MHTEINRQLLDFIDNSPSCFHAVESLCSMLEEAGAVAVGFNCVAADNMLPGLVSKLRRYVKGALVCKPNAGVPVIGEDKLAHYSMAPAEFAAIVRQCYEMGASILGGCCGTAPEYIEALTKIL